MTIYRYNKETKKVEAHHDQHPSHVPFIQTTRSPPHGKHRRTYPQAHRDPADGAGAGTGRTITWATAYPANFNPFVPSTSARGGGKSLALQDFADLILRNFGPKHPVLPYAGIRSGEIIGHRMWWVLERGLCSLAHPFIWQPGATIEGDVNEVVYYYYGKHPIWGGVYAYAELGGDLLSELRIYRQALSYSISRHCVFQHGHPANYALGLVRGTVKLWGDVIEHELGWRAQYAKLRSIDEWWGDSIRVPEILEPYRASLTSLPLP